MYRQLQKDETVKYYDRGNWLTHELVNGPIPVPPQMGRILLCLLSYQPPTDANRHLVILDDMDDISRRRVVPKTPPRQRITSAPGTPSTLLDSMSIMDVDQLIQQGALFEIEKHDNGEEFWINSVPSRINTTPPSRNRDETHNNTPWKIHTELEPKTYLQWPEMVEDMDNFFRPLHEHLVAADALRKAQSIHGDWVTGSKFYELWWKYRACVRKGLISKYYGEPFKKAAKEITNDDIAQEKTDLVRTGTYLQGLLGLILKFQKKIKEENKEENGSPTKKRRVKQD